MSRELLKEHIHLLLEYDDYYSSSGSSGLFNTFIKPFVNVGKVSVAGAKKITASMKGLLSIIYRSIKQTIFPLIDQDFDEVVNKRDNEIKQINEKNKELYNQINSVFNNEILTLFFMYSPVSTLVLYKKLSKKQSQQDYDDLIISTNKVSNQYKNAVKRNNILHHNNIENISSYDTKNIMSKLENNKEYKQLTQNSKDEIREQIVEYSKSYYKSKIDEEIKNAIANGISPEHPLIKMYKSLV